MKQPPMNVINAICILIIQFNDLKVDLNGKYKISESLFLRESSAL